MEFIVRFLRMPISIVASVTFCLLAQWAFAEPRVTAHVSDQDRASIVAAVGTVTQAPILSIYTDYHHKPVPGSVPCKATFLGTDRGQSCEITIYESTDRVGVFTGDYRNPSGGDYLVVKRGASWAVEAKGFWMGRPVPSLWMPNPYAKKVFGRFWIEELHNSTRKVQVVVSSGGSGTTQNELGKNGLGLQGWSDVNGKH